MDYWSISYTVTTIVITLLSLTGSVSGGYCSSNSGTLYCPQPGDPDDYSVCCRKNGLYYCCTYKLLGAILGGVFGVLALIAYIILVVCCVKIKRGDWVCVKTGPSRRTLITKKKLEQLQRQKAEIEDQRMKKAVAYARYGVQNPHLTTEQVIQMAPIQENGASQGGSVSSQGQAGSVYSQGQAGSVYSQGQAGSVSSQGQAGSVYNQGQGGSVSSQGQGGSVSSQGQGGTVSSQGQNNFWEADKETKY